MGRVLAEDGPRYKLSGHREQFLVIVCTEGLPNMVVASLPQAKVVSTAGLSGFLFFPFFFFFLSVTPYFLISTLID